MFERIYPEAISWLSIAAFVPLSGLLGNSVSKSGHWQPRSIITTNPIDASLECAGLFLGGKLGTKNSFKKMCSLQCLILLKIKHTAIQMSVLVTLTKYVENSDSFPVLSISFSPSAALQSGVKCFSSVISTALNPWAQTYTRHLQHNISWWKYTFKSMCVVNSLFSQQLKRYWAPYQLLYYYFIWHWALHSLRFNYCCQATCTVTVNN